MDFKKKIAREINETFTSINNLTEGDSTFRLLKNSDDLVSIWSFLFILPTGEEKKYLIVVSNAIAIDFISIKKNDKEGVKLQFSHKEFTFGNVYDRVFYIDIVSQFVDEKNDKLSQYFSLHDKIRAVFEFENPSTFYNKLFNYYGYEEFMIEDLDFFNVNKYYVDRKIKAMVATDSSLNISNHLQNVLTDWSEQSGLSNILILGDRGMGKSWATKAYCIQQNKKHKENPWLTPPAIFIELAKLADPKARKSSMLKTILHHIKTIYNISFLFGDDSLEALISSGKVILVLDGYDDMSKEVNTESINHQLYEVFSIIYQSSKVILTSRVNHFDSIMKIYEHFSFSTYKDKKRESGVLVKDITHIGNMRIRGDFNIWRLDNMDKEEVNELSKNYKESSNELGEGEIIISALRNKNVKTHIEEEMLILSTIPAFYNTIARLVVYPEKTQIQIYRESIIMTVINYNILTNRSVEQFSERFGDNFTEVPFDYKRKFEVLEGLCWFMFERNMSTITLNELSKFLNNFLDVDYEEILNDIKTQTVIKLVEDNNYLDEKFEFLSNGIFAYFIASHIHNILKNSNNFKIGIKELGKYDLSSTSLGQSVLSFLIELIKNENNYDEANIISTVTEIILDEKPYSNYTQFLVDNLNFMGFTISTLKNIDSWSRKPIEIETELVLISTFWNSLEPFKICRTPITNNEYYKFIKSNYGENWGKRNIPLKLKKLINDYHLYLWKGEELLNEQLNLPVVYIGWFTAANYCNWLSINNNIEPFYEFQFEKDNFIKVITHTESIGYRLPSASEWLYVVKEGQMVEEYNFPWDKMLERNGSSQKLVDEYKKSLLNANKDSVPVMAGLQNEFGLYGLIGNVKEWVDDGIQETIVGQVKPIKGLTSLTGEDGFNFNTIINIPGQNTNVDVGFRVAKSLTKDEIETIKNEYSLKNN